MNRDAFVADRSGRLDRFDHVLEPIVEKALHAWPDEDWFDPIVHAATDLWEGIGPEDAHAITDFVRGLAGTLSLTTDPEHATGNQAAAIARWVSTYTANHSEHSAGRAAGKLSLRWLTRHDDRVRALHREIDGETVPFGQKFDVGGFKLRFPGDPVGPPEVWINCRCLAQSLEEGTVVAAASSADTYTPAPVTFHGVAAPTDTPSGDGRQLARDGFSHRDLPIPFNYQRGTSHGGDSGPAVTVGRIDAMHLDDDGLVRYSGTFNMGVPETAEAISHIQDGSMRGVSVDVDSAKEQYADLPSPDDFATEAEFVDAMQSMVKVFSTWRISGLTMCSIPAFAEAFVSLADSPAVVASGAPTINLVASAAALPGEWFQNPGLSAPTPFTVMDDGRVFGHLAAHGVCHIGIQGRCTTPPLSASGYAYYRTGVVNTTIGDIPVGHITMGAGHADLRAGAQAAAAHYDNVATAVADVAAGEDIHGIWVAGALRPGVTDEQRHALKASALSGDWREIRGHLELVAALAVNTPGFPIPRLSLAASGDVQTALVAAGIVAGPEVTHMADVVPGPAAPTDPVAPDATAEPVVDTSPERISKDLRAIDAAIDSTVAFLNGFGDGLPPEAQQARDLAVAADDVIDQLMRDLGIPDPEDEAGQPGEPLEPAGGLVASAIREGIRTELARRERLATVRAQHAKLRSFRLDRARRKVQ